MINFCVAIHDINGNLYKGTSNFLFNYANNMKCILILIYQRKHFKTMIRSMWHKRIEKVLHKKILLYINSINRFDLETYHSIHVFDYCALNTIFD